MYTQATKWKLWSGENPIKHVYVGKRKAVREKRILSAADLNRLLIELPEGDPPDGAAIAHEIAHVLSIRVMHSKTCITREYWSLADFGLMQKSALEFTEMDIQLIQEGLPPSSD